MRAVLRNGFRPAPAGEETTSRQAIPKPLKQRQEQHRAKYGGHARAPEPRRRDDEAAGERAGRQSEQA